MTNKKKLVLVVTPDEYELPMSVHDSIRECAEYLGITQDQIDYKIHNDKIKRDRTFSKTKYRIRPVDFEVEEWKKITADDAVKNCKKNTSGSGSTEKEATHRKRSHRSDHQS